MRADMRHRLRAALGLKAVQNQSVLQEGILRSFRLYVIFRACPGNVVM